MKKALLFIFIAGTLLLGACKKEKTAPTPPDNFFTYDGGLHTVISSSRSVVLTDQKAITFKGDGKWSLILLFKNYPTISGTYQMGINDNQIADNEFRLSGTDGDGGYFYYQRSLIPIEVKVDGTGKVSVNIPEILVGFPQPSSAYKLTAEVYEK